MSEKNHPFALWRSPELAVVRDRLEEYPLELQTQRHINLYRQALQK